MPKPKPVIRPKKNKFQNALDLIQKQKTENMEIIDKGGYPEEGEYPQDLLNEVEGVLQRDDWYDRFKRENE